MTSRRPLDAVISRCLLAASLALGACAHTVSPRPPVPATVVDVADLDGNPVAVLDVLLPDRPGPLAAEIPGLWRADLAAGVDASSWIGHLHQAPSLRPLTVSRSASGETVLELTAWESIEFVDEIALVVPADGDGRSGYVLWYGDWDVRGQRVGVWTASAPLAVGLNTVIVPSPTR